MLPPRIVLCKNEHCIAIHQLGFRSNRPLLDSRNRLLPVDLTWEYFRELYAASLETHSTCVDEMEVPAGTSSRGGRHFQVTVGG